MSLKMNTGLKIYTTPLPLAFLALLPSLTLVIVDLAIFHAFMTTRMLLLSALRAFCFSSANITDFIEKYEETCDDFSIFKDDRLMRSIIELITSKTKSLTQLLDALFNLNFKFDSKTATKPLLNIPLKMLEIRSASKKEFKLLLSVTDHKDEEKEEVEDTKVKCKIIAFARTSKTQLKLLINTGISINTLSYLSSIKIASVEINAAARDKAKKPFQPSKGSKPTKIKKNVRQQKEKNYGTFKAHSKDKLFDGLIKEESSRPSRLTKADEAIKDIEREVEITQRVSRKRKKKTYRRKKFIDLYVITKAQEKAIAAIIKSRIEV
ncbi:hypothetical protein MBM_09521 [Drepanopeziza brunnea f. sp. 'multigermtubi' MB_m1]|uniref:Uncharacterized protein n=1 Tax=Marssonina brunnea f. sp. multigermtubi (strain MB_m1) TaxID=1072389 RepID=K1WHK9_MARBU|nr:uncharacterized protein MBM_09521 [Drepanopeziza brunnea f. sp. 'multigermtubi' MB_m1]EKD12346.1 hypothetical protein MBM_09521 [Drepanopeziza brunnea f. sp. 'multigermtubi' MB_m1]